MWGVLSRLPGSVVIGGLTVVPWDDDGLNLLLRARLALALELIDRYDPRLGTRLRRDVRGIWFIPAGNTHWRRAMRVIALDLRWETLDTIEDLALTLVHEATHARHAALGVRYEGKQARAEAACIRASMEFADRLEPGQVSDRPSLDALEDPWWTREKFAKKVAEAHKIMGMPPFLSSILLRRLK
jgi:hypothetical protein